MSQSWNSQDLQPTYAVDSPTSHDFAAHEDNRLLDWRADKAVELEELLSIHEYERQRLGQELHDSAGQLLISAQLSVAHLRVVDANSGHTELIDDISETLGEISKQIRALAFLHYPAELADRGLGSAVECLVRGFAKRTGITTSFEGVGDFAKIGERSATALLRIAQEALVNIHRHAHAASASVSLKMGSRSAELTVRDDGVGIPEEGLIRPQGIGLKGMQHRVGKLRGRLRVSNMRPGTEIFASVPIAG
jgi:signal transduction histidine kinase